MLEVLAAGLAWLSAYMLPALETFFLEHNTHHLLSHFNTSGWHRLQRLNLSTSVDT